MKKSILTKLLVIMCIVALLIPMGCQKKAEETKAPAAAAGPQIIKLRIGAGHAPENVTWTGAMEYYFVPQVNKLLAERGNKYQIEWVKGYGGTIAKLGEVLEAVESNLLDVGWVGTVFEPASCEVHNLSYAAPFTTPDAELQNRLFEKLYYETNPWLAEDFEKKFNQKLLGIASVENYNMFTTFPVKGPQDFKGKKIGGAGANLHWMTGTGAVGVQSSAPESYTNIQTGVVDGVIQPSASVLKANIFEVAKYMVKIDFGAIMCGGVTINLDVFNKLPKEVQQVMIDAGKGYTKEQGIIANKAYADQLERAKKAGMQIIELTPEAKAAWAKMLPNLPMEFAKKMDAQGYQATKAVNDYLKSVEAAGITLPRKWYAE